MAFDEPGSNPRGGSMVFGCFQTMREHFANICPQKPSLLLQIGGQHDRLYRVRTRPRKCP